MQSAHATCSPAPRARAQQSSLGIIASAVLAAVACGDGATSPSSDRARERASQPAAPAERTPPAAAESGTQDGAVSDPTPETDAASAAAAPRASASSAANSGRILEAPRPAEPVRDAPPPPPLDAGRGDTDDAGDPPAPVPSQHPVFASVAIEDADSLNPFSHGDLWPSCWSDDDAIYAANGDGGGFSFGLFELDIVVNRIDGVPGDPRDPVRGESLASGAQVSSIWSGANYNRKPTGMLCVRGELYLAVQDLRRDTYSDAPAASIVRSRDKGRTWTWDPSAPMFANHTFTTIMFIDYGKDSQHAPDAYAYAFGLDQNWGFTTTRPAPTRLFLARVPNDHIQERTRWEFFAGLDARGAPTWTADIAARVAVISDDRMLYTTPLSTDTEPNQTVIGQGGILYHAASKRYIYSSWSTFTFEFYEAPAPWGPWTHFYSKDNGAYPWSDTKNGGYATTLPSKFVSADGQSLWMQCNAWGHGVENYTYSLRRVELTPYVASAASNDPSPVPLSRPAERATAFVRASHFGLPQLLNDGIVLRQSEDSRTGDIKSFDYWGYTWPRAIRADEVHYTTGGVSARGGWFRDLHVEVRRQGQWRPVSGLRIEPAYAYDASVPANTTFRMRFDASEGDGFRIAGTPGGTQFYTSIAELGVYFTGEAR